MKRFVIALMVCLTAGMSAVAQNNVWEPTGVWPFVNKKFLPATVYAGYVRPSKTIVPCNIHIGNQTLWYAQNDTMMEAIPGTILRVEFSNGDVYVPVGMNLLGLVVQQDTINGKLGRVIEVVQADQEAIDERARSLQNQMTMLQGFVGGLSSYMAGVADANGGIKQEEQVLPLQRSYYFVYNNELFEANDKNIMKRLPKERHKEYRIFNRSAEIISSNRSSMLKVWNEFFLKSK